MIVKRFYDEKLAQASYLIGCGATGDALVVDANRDVEQYVRAAEAEKLKVTAVTETHIHADYVSGSRELAARTGAQLYLSAEGGDDWQYAFAAGDGATLVRDGDRFSVGNVRVTVLHTPGHTPEHLSFLITDSAAADRPIAAVTGDFIFVGDVGRPDLLEKAAGVAGTMEAGARSLFASLRRFKAQQPDWLQIWPGHGAGSACGKGMSAVPHSTLGYEKLFNWALSEESEDAFVRAVLAGQPEPPKYFAQMKRINREGPEILNGFPQPQRMEPDALAGVLESGAMVVDTRAADAFAQRHVPGTINIPLNRSFSTWAGSLVPFGQPFYLIAADDAGAATPEAVRDLAMIGLDRVAGWFGTDAVATWTGAGGTMQSVPQITAEELRARMDAGEVEVIDVRGRAEWDAGHLPNVPNIPLGSLPDRLDEVPRGKTVVLQCQGGARSAIAASVLQARGIGDVVNLAGGYQAWHAAGLPVEKPEDELVPA
jgi:hydroxyacylglutathione hydrolase